MYQLGIGADLSNWKVDMYEHVGSDDFVVAGDLPVGEPSTKLFCGRLRSHRRTLSAAFLCCHPQQLVGCGVCGVQIELPNVPFRRLK